MQQRYDHDGLVWIDLESPTRSEVRDITNEFELDALIAEELLLPTARPRIEHHDSVLYIILHFPALRHTHKSSEQEIDFVVGKKFIITTRYDTIDPLHNFSKVFEVNSMLDKSTLGDHAGFIFYFMMKKLYSAVEYEVEHVRASLHHIEQQIFEGKEKEMVEAISVAARDLLNLRQAIEPHRDVLQTLENEGKTVFGNDFTPYLRALTNEYYRVHNHIMRHTESIHELRETNNSLITTKQNEVMKTLTLMAFVTFPLSLVATIFGMNTSLPIVGHQYDFWIVIGGMSTGMVFMFIFFKYKKWL